MRQTAESTSYDLRRFVDAQNPVFDEVCAELRRGRKNSHWMWFVFPQIKGLGASAMASKYAIASRDEAVAYLQHPVLGTRLRECTQLVLAIPGRSARQIFGYPDDLKFRSSMTLFAQATSDNALFVGALEKYFAGKPDAATLEKLPPAAGSDGATAGQRPTAHPGAADDRFDDAGPTPDGPLAGIGPRCTSNHRVR